MSKILCATRGGEASIRAQNAAIERALAEKKGLVFFLVLDVEFMINANYGMRTDVVKKALDGLGEFLLTAAVERAKKAGLEDVSYRLKRGRFTPALIEVLEDEDISLIVLGTPEPEQSIFTELAGLEAFAADLSEKTGIEVWLAD